MKNKVALLFTLFLTACAVPTRIDAAESTLSYDDATLSMPHTISKNKTFEIVDQFTFEKDSVRYVFQSDLDNTSTTTAEWGYRDGGLYVRHPGGSFPTRLKGLTNLSKAINDATGVMMYYDASDSISINGDNIGLGVGFILMNHKNEPASDSSLTSASKREGHFQYYYLVEGRSAFYYDETKGQFVPTSIVGRTATVKEGFQGYIYFPFNSFGWNGEKDDSYRLPIDAFDRGYNWLNYTHLYCDRFDISDTQHDVFIDNLTFVKDTSTICDHQFDAYSSISKSCYEISADVLKCSSCGNIKLSNVNSARGHNFMYGVYNGKSYQVCMDCDHVELDEGNIVEPNHPDTLTKKVHKIDLYYGYYHEYKTTRYVLDGNTLSKQEEPQIPLYRLKNQFDYTFLSWSSDQRLYTPTNPLTTETYRDLSYYAEYLISSYDNIKYDHVINDISVNSKIYNPVSLGKIVINGNSNMSLAFNAVEEFRAHGLEAVKNPIAGGTAYSYLEYVDPLVIAHRPKLFYFGLSSNDQAYWSMSEKDALNNAIKFIEYIHEMLPDCVIAVLSATPLPGRSEAFATILRLNNLMKKHCENVSYLEYIDVYSFVYERMMEFPEGWDMWTHMDNATLSVLINLHVQELLKIIAKHRITF